MCWFILLEEFVGSWIVEMDRGGRCGSHGSVLMEIGHVFGIHASKLFLDGSALDGLLFVVATDSISSTIFFCMAASNLDDQLLRCHAFVDFLQPYYVMDLVPAFQ